MKSAKVQQVEIDRFPPGFDPEDYWQRINLGNIDWGEFVTGHDIFVDLNLMENGWGDFVAIDADEANKCIGNLYAEAVANKRGTIPAGATVELRFGPFTQVELTERGPKVVAILRTATGEFYDVVFVPRDAWSTFRVPEDIPSPRREAIMAAVNLLIAAVIRDFWVVEEREAVFERRAMSPTTVPRSPSDRPSIVYLPRIQYLERPNVQQCVNNLGHTKRRLHTVVAHLRRLTNGRHASDQQKILAMQYGFQCDEGYTFVAAYQRGGDKRDVIYRSRSALDSLCPSGKRV